MKNSYSHFILYSKGWYLKTHKYIDMQILIGHWSGLDPMDVDDHNIFSVMSTMIYPYIKDERTFANFVANVMQYKWDKQNKFTTMEKFIQACLDILSELQIYESQDWNNPDIKITLIELDEPDYINVLPKRRDM